MNGLDLTYGTLATTRNEAAVDVLILALDDSDSATRRRALDALMARSEPRCPAEVLANWDKLQPADLGVLRRKTKWIESTVAEALGGSGDSVETAIEVAEALQLTAVMPQLTLIAESSASRTLRARATSAVLEIASRLGDAARNDRDQPTQRGPVLVRLADSVHRFSMHRNESLVDAYLLVSTWGDGDLRKIFSEGGQEMKLLCDRFATSDRSGVIDLLAGFVRRKNVPERVAQIIQSRTDESFREALLRRIGREPTANTVRNLQEIGMPNCCRGGEELIDSIASDYRAPLVHVYVSSHTDPLETLHVIAATAERGEPASVTAAASALMRCALPEDDIWMRAALTVADGDENAIRSDDNARLLKRLIDLFEHTDPGVVKGARRVLEPLHAMEMLPRFQSLRPRSRRRLGRVVMMVDPEAINRVQDALRHPVLQKRLEAIAMADALAIVDLLSDSFAHIVREDHLEARMHAAEAMSQAEGEFTLSLLKELTELPECPVRDTAIQAINKREKQRVR